MIGNAEKFCFAISMIPGFSLRISALHFINRSEEMINDLLEEIDFVQKAFE